KIEALYRARYHPESEITVLVSASEALYAAISAFVHADDEVVYFEPAFDSYAPVVRLQGAKPVAVQLRPDLFKIDWDEVAAAITARTRMIILNSPHNPTATVIDEHDVERLTALTRNTDIVVLSDEVYEHIVFDGGIHHSMSRY